MTSEPDPRTDLAGWLGLKPAQVSRCRSEAEAGDGTVAAVVGRRLIAQDQAGWLGLKPAQVSRCRSEAEAGDGTVAAVVGRRLIAQDQADTPDPEPDDGLIAVTLRLTADEFGASRAIHLNSFSDSDYGRSARKLTEACRDLPAPKPPWTSPLPNLPDLTEQQCRDCYDTGIDPYCCDPWAQIGRALKAAGWTPKEEA